MDVLLAYSAFALTIASEVPLPELPQLTAAASEPDVEIHIGNTGGNISADFNDSETLQVVVDGTGAHGWIPGVGAFRVSSGRYITVDPVLNYDDRSLRLAIVGPLLGVILSQRSKFVLHASTIAIGGRAVAFCGASGAGKSTLAAALMRMGHPLIADDMTVIDTHGANPWVQPGFPRIKLWPDSASALAYDADALPLLHPDRSKRSLSVAAGFHPQPLPLARCYLLQAAGSASIRELSASEAILSLVKCTYQAGWLQRNHTAGANLMACGSLVRSTVVRELRQRHRFDALPELIRLIEEDNESASDTLASVHTSD